jgi:FtsP/CotA-like multicopper oxidase with cupredoxin domain
MLRMNARAHRRQTFALASALILPAHLISATAAAAERIAHNDNRAAAGTMANGTLTVRLETRIGEWHPDGDGQPGVTVKAFAIEGGPLQVPGPILRVPEGTYVRIFVSNRLDDALVLHGLYARTGSDASPANPIAVPGGGTREVTFLAGRPGTYFYWAANFAGTDLRDRSGSDSQLSGAFVVDPAGGPEPDRVFVIGFWEGLAPGGGNVDRYVINGLSWPQTERLTYRVGERVRMRVINASAAVHPMHLHGFYFNVDSRGDEREDRLFAQPSSPHMVVTERLAPGRTFTLTWVPTRPGNWLFHCHDNVHLTHGGALDGSR